MSNQVSEWSMVMTAWVKNEKNGIKGKEEKKTK